MYVALSARVLNPKLVISARATDEQAEEKLRQAKLLRTEVLGADHPDTLTTRLMLVRQMIDRGTAGQAEAGAASHRGPDDGTL